MRFRTVSLPIDLGCDGFTGTCTKLFASVGHRHRPGVPVRSAALRARALDSNHVPDLHRIAGPAIPLDHRRRAHLEGPVFDLACRRVSHVDVEVNVGIVPFDLCDRAGHLNRFSTVVLRGKGVMRRQRRREHG